MNELVNLVAQKVGITADQARGAVDTVLGFLKAKMPSGLAEQCESFIGGAKEEGEGVIDKIKKGVGSLVGNK